VSAGLEHSDGVVLEEAAVSVVVRKQMLAQAKLEKWVMILKYSIINHAGNIQYPNVTTWQGLC
jgi:hypothetical protein